jgi:N-acetylneuraminate synthase
MSPVPFAPAYLHLGERLIGEGQPCFIIAEAGVNHNGSLQMAIKLVDVAVAAGADAVKFQKRELKELYPPELLADPNSAEWAFQYLLPILKQVELSDDEFRIIKTYCDERGIRFMCTPWDEASLSFLELLGVDIYKVASADLVNLPLLERIAQTDKPMILSTGMATLPEIEQTVAFLKAHGASFAMLHCVSTYPAPFDGLNLRFIETLKQFGVPVGYSSHERGIAMSLVALTLGACIVEKHITLDRTLPGPDHPASLEPAGIEKLVRDIRHAEEALGSREKSLSAMEMLNRQVLRKSLVAAQAIPAGTVVTRELVRVKGPGKGLSPQRMAEIIGKKLQRDLQPDECFTERDVAPATNVQIHTRAFQRPWGLKARFHDLMEILERQPRIVELHFSEADVDRPYTHPSDQPFAQQLFIHAPEFAGSHLLDLCAEDEARVESSLVMLQRTIDRATALRAHFRGPASVVVHVGGMSMDEPIRNRDRLLSRAADAFRRLEPKGVVLLPENLPPKPWYFGGQWVQNTFMRPEEMVEFCRAVGTGMTLDISHAQLYCNAYGRSLREYVRLCLPHVQHLHFADALGEDGEGVQIGEGVVEWGELLELLSRREFTWVPEIWSGHLHGGAGFAEAINRLGEYGKL